MKILTVLAVVAFIACRNSDAEVAALPQDDVRDFPGIIVKVNSESYAIHSDPMFGAFQSFVPINLPGEFKIDQLRVTVSGKTQEIPPNVRLIGVPLKISSINMRN